MNEAVSSESASSWRESATLLRASAGLGTLAWLGARVFLDLDIVKSTLLLGLSVVVPLALSLLPPGEGGKLFGWMSVLQPLAGLGAGYALVLQPRGPAALFTVPWLGLSALGAVLGIARARVRDRAHSELVWALGLLLFPIGAGWLFVSRAGLDPLGTGSLIVLLTAVHFHFAAFAAFVVVACTARTLELGVATNAITPGLLKLVRVIAVAMVVGIFLVAAGISGVRILGLLGSALLTLALFMNASLMLSHARRRVSSSLARALLVISALSVLLSMPMALAWAYGQLSTPTIEMQWMIRIHGMANAHGFVLTGLFAFFIERRREAE